MFDKINIVIGANYGDEGKGLVTDKLCYENRSKKIVNVLFNGGFQRGHTVELFSGQRHVFHHLGSGSYVGADTYFDKDFLIEPFSFIMDKRDFKNVKVMVHPECRVITPYDIALNIAREKRDGNNKAGSCGCGIWETMHRYEVSQKYNLNYYQVQKLSYDDLVQYLAGIKTEYAANRLKEYGQDFNIYMDIKPTEAADMFNDFLEHLKIVDSYEYLSENYEMIIFEGGQGLLLDKDNEDEKPHVTSSNTGASIPIKRIQKFMDRTETEIHYVTRRYLTRHGAGKLEGECLRIDVNGSIDKTNSYNQYQGSLRYAPLNFEDLLKRVKEDLNKSVSADMKLNTVIDVTHSEKAYTQKIDNITVNYINQKAFHV